MQTSWPQKNNLQYDLFMLTNAIITRWRGPCRALRVGETIRGFYPCGYYCAGVTPAPVPAPVSARASVPVPRYQSENHAPTANTTPAIRLPTARSG
jgi:hypothetical protein